MRRWGGLWVLVWIGLVQGAAAEERYALIVSGASGGKSFAQTYDTWRTALVTALRTHLQVPDDRIVVLAETAGPGVGRATREGVERAVRALASRMSPQATLLVVLIGHGTSDGVSAKFNLVGPDLDAAEWAALLADLPGRLVFVNTTGASFPFLSRLAGPRRIVITATSSEAQRYDTVFPEFFVRAFDDEAADLDKNRRISIWEAFAYASLQVRRWYEQRGQLPTERALLDDTGDGVGLEADQAGEDGTLARATFLDAPVEPVATDPELARLVERRTLLERQIEELKARKAAMPPEEYARELERLLLELARVSREIRAKS
jgi:hypothetical protein